MLSLLAFNVVAGASAETPPGLPGLRVVRSEMIWDAAPHNAFTDLVRWRDRWYCSFREAVAHSSYDGAARILVSDDGRAWRSAVRFTQAGLDLRDPKLCSLPDGRLLLGVGLRRQVSAMPDTWETHSAVYITADGETWDGPRTVGDPNVWMWRYVAHANSVYSFGYAKPPSKAGGGKTFLRFYRSPNGQQWETVTETEAGGGFVNEAAFAFEPDGRCVALLRREGALGGRLGLAPPPYTDWKWSELEVRFNGPALLRLPDGRFLAGGRAKTLGATSAMTALGWLTTDPATLRPALRLPCKGETGYPGLCFQDGRVWASYYASQSGKCAIYIAELELLPPSDSPRQ
jgi:hypothetical protein